MRTKPIFFSYPQSGALFDAGHTAGGQAYLVMEYIEGVPLDEFAGHPDLRNKLILFLQVCSALAYAHPPSGDSTRLETFRWLPGNLV